MDAPARKKMVFAQTVESIFAPSIARDLTPRGRRRLEEAGLVLGKKLRAEYPLETVRGWMDILRQDLYPGMPRERADELLGRRMVEGLAQTLLGRALVPILRLLGPARAVRRMEENMRHLTNFTRLQMRLTGDDEAEYWIEEPGISSDYTRGEMLAIFEAIGYPRTTVDLVPGTSPGFTFRIRWSELAEDD